MLSINITVRSEVQLLNCPIYLTENSILPFDQSKDNTSGVQKTDKHKKLAETDQTESNFSIRFQFQCWIFLPKIDRVYIYIYLFIYVSLKHNRVSSLVE